MRKKRKEMKLKKGKNEVEKRKKRKEIKLKKGRE